MPASLQFADVLKEASVVSPRPTRECATASRDPNSRQYRLRGLSRGKAGVTRGLIFL